MTPTTYLCMGVAMTAIVTASVGHAQPRTGWLYQLNGLVAFQGDADLDDGGEVSATRTALRFAAIYQFETGTAAGVSVSLGQQDYSFGDNAQRLWDDVNGVSVSAPLRFQFGQSARGFVAPSVRWAYEDGASKSDSVTYGVFAGVSWQVNDSLRIGPAFGAFSELEGGSVSAFPALLLDWEISDRISLSTGSGVAATQGPGLRLSYAYSDALDLSLAARIEDAEFRLDKSGLAPGGVGNDSSVPVVVALDYNPNPGFSVSVYAGAAFEGELKLEDASGNQVSKQSYETAPLAGLAFRLRF